MPRPMPRVLPVITATLSLSLMGFFAPDGACFQRY